MTPQSIEDVKAATEKECARLKAGWLASEENALMYKNKATKLEDLLAEVQHALINLQDESSKLQHQSMKLQSTLLQSNQHLERAYQSRSWRWTAFLRKIDGFLRRKNKS